MRSSPSAVYELQETPTVRPVRQKRRRSPLRHKLEDVLFRSLLAFLRLLPRAGASALAGNAAWFLTRASPRRRILFRNVAHAFPDRPRGEVARVARGSVENTAHALLDYLDASDGTLDDLRARVEFSGLEHLRSGRARGKGVFLLSAHFGSWEIAALAVGGLLGEPIASVVRALDNPILERELTRRRTRFGNRVIYKKEAARELLRAMRKNESVAILVDQNVLPREAVFVPFFGRLAATTPSLALLHLKTEAAVVPVFTWPLPGGRYRVGFEEPLLVGEDAATPRAERVRRLTERYMRVTEAAVRREPAAWLWIHDRWKTRPPE